MSAEAPEKDSLPELRRIILEHIGRYPGMEATDLVKLCYQNEFAGGHMISDPAASLRRLLAEWNETPAADIPLYEDIGGGLVRLNLAAAKLAGLSPEDINRSFCAAASVRRGDMSSFISKLSLLEGMAEEGLLPVGLFEMRSFIEGYVLTGCPAVSHSEEYRRRFSPHYRVVGKS